MTSKIQHELNKMEVPKPEPRAVSRGIKVYNLLNPKGLRESKSGTKNDGKFRTHNKHRVRIKSPMIDEPEYSQI